MRIHGGTHSGSNVHWCEKCEMYDALVAMWPKKPQGWNLDKSVFIGNDRAFAVTVGFATVQTPEDAIQLNALNEATVDP